MEVAMRKGSFCVLLVGALLFGCGSDSDGTPSGTEIQEKLLYANLGLVRGDQPTVMKVNVAKPFYHEGTFELAEPVTGPFAPAEGTLPAKVPSGHEFPIWLTFTPPAGVATAQEGIIRLLFQRPGSSIRYPVTLQLRAEVETPSAQILQTQASAGDVIVGETREFGIYIENTSKVTPISVTEVTPPQGDFALAPDAFPVPAPVGPGSRFLVRLLYAPQSMGSSSSTIRVFHSADALPFEATVTGNGVERPTARLLDTDVPAGNVVVGEKVQIGVDFENTSLLTVVDVTGVTLPDGEFTLAPDAPVLPVAVAPGATLHIPLIYAPEGVWDASAVVQVSHTANSELLEATLTGTGLPPRIYHDFTVSLDWWTGESDWVTVNVPAEAVSIFIEATGEPWSLIDLVEMKGPGDKVYESYYSGPLDWMSFYPAGGYGYLNVELPNTDAPDVQLVAGGGDYSFRLKDWYGASTLTVRVTVSLRTAGAVEEGTLDLRIFLADGLGIYYDPLSDAKLAEVVDTIDAISAMNGIRLGNVSFSLLDPTFDALDPWWAEYMFETCTVGYPEGALNLFLVADMSSWWGVLGIAGAAPGPAANGTIYSGVAIDFNAADGITVGATAAHEIGHYLGHLDVGNEGWLLMPEEAYPVLRHPLLNPGLPQAFFSPPETTNEAQILDAIDVMPPMDLWCGTCTRPPAR